jgi:exodeoxyribonuclease V alpha subunit
MSEEIDGTVERVSFHNANDGFVVLRVRPKGTSGVVTVVGHIAAVAEGESILAKGGWRDDRTHGRQFMAETIAPQRAQGRLQIETFLGSGAIRGVGPSTAKLMYVHFGEKVFDVLDQTPERLRELPGIGPLRARMIGQSWSEQRGLRELMLFLTDSGIGTTRAARIQKQFGPDAIRLIKENPYRLAREIRGIGFTTADRLALQLGIERDSIERIRAGAVHALSEASAQGHCGLPSEELIALCAEMLGIDRDRIGEAIALEVEARRLIRDSFDGREALFLPWLFLAEKTIASELRRLARGDLPWPGIDVEKALQWVEARTRTHLSPSQRQAIALVLRSKVSVITGGPGVGKTTLVNSILQIVRAKKGKVLLAAPTGRAAKRLAESTRRPARTVHRLLEINPETGDFARHEGNQLDCDLLVVDEASMIDVLLMQAIVRALRRSAALLLVGDVDQLPAVGPGQVLSDIIRSEAVPVIRLSEVFRQAARSRIITSAHDINEGKAPNLKHNAGEESDFYFVRARENPSVTDRIVELVAERIPKKFGFDPLREIQVLTPMRRTAAGVEALNSALQAALNPNARDAGSPRLECLGTTFFPGDKVMQIVNDYEKDVFNGDIGLIQAIDPEKQTAIVEFEGREIEYPDDEIEDLVLSYATTIHKSQGSEYPAVVIALTMRHSIMLQRNLLYTAVTRGKKLVVIVGEERAVRQAVEGSRARRRWTKLREWLAPES